MDHGIVEVRGQHIPAQGGQCGQKEERPGGAGMEARDHHEPGHARADEHGAKQHPRHPRLKEADAGGREEPANQPVVDQAVGVAEVAGLPQGVEEVEEEDPADDDAPDVERQRMDVCCQAFHRTHRCSAPGLGVGCGRAERGAGDNLQG